PGARAALRHGRAAPARGRRAARGSADGNPATAHFGDRACRFLSGVASSRVARSVGVGGGGDPSADLLCQLDDDPLGAAGGRRTGAWAAGGRVRGRGGGSHTLRGCCRALTCNRTRRTPTAS